MNARRTAVRLTFAGVDISTDINKHLLSLTYTDNEEDKTDDLQLSLDDREGVWLGNWCFPNKKILRNSPCLPACKQKNIATRLRDTT